MGTATTKATKIPKYNRDFLEHKDFFIFFSCPSVFCKFPLMYASLFIFVTYESQKRKTDDLVNGHQRGME